jgi:hypothetical protein
MHIWLDIDGFPERLTSVFAMVKVWTACGELRGYCGQLTAAFLVCGPQPIGKRKDRGLKPLA